MTVGASIPAAVGLGSLPPPGEFEVVKDKVKIIDGPTCHASRCALLVVANKYANTAITSLHNS